MKQWPYYINLYYKYTHGSFNIDNEIYYFQKYYITFIFVKIKIIRPKNQISYPKLNAPYFWNNYIIFTIILDLKCPKGSHHSVLSPTRMFDKANCMKATLECGENLAWLKTTCSHMIRNMWKIMTFFHKWY